MYFFVSWDPRRRSVVHSSYGMLAVHRPRTAGGLSSNGGSAVSVLGGQVKRKRNALNEVANAQQSVASELDGKQ